MISSFLLAVHLSGAAATGLVATYAVVAMVRGTSTTYRKTSLLLGALAGFEVLSGVALSISSSQITTLSICANVVMYLSVVFFVETLLFVQMKKETLVFPLRAAISPTLASLLLMFVAISYGF